MKKIKHFFIVFFISFLIFLIIISILKPIFITKELIFPYAINPFDIISKYPILWKYIKIIYCITCFFNVFLFINSISKFILIKLNNKSNILKKEKPKIYENTSSNFKLLLGIDNLKNNIYILEKGLYQNILITGTIGSRKNCFLHVPIFKPVN